MKTLQDYIDKLNALNFKDMYNSDFFLTWEKTDDELEAVFTLADALRFMRENNISTKVFESGLGISLFRDNSTRTRFSFASACNLLGLEVQDLDEGKSQIAHGETVRETANMISFMADVIGIRDDMYIGKGNAYMHEVIDAVTEGHKDGILQQKPTLVNLQCDIDHPTQAMADMLHIIHEFGGVENLKGKKLRMTRVRVPGKEVCMAHIISRSDEVIYQNLGLHIGTHEGENHTGESIGLLRFTPWEAVVVAADVAFKSADVEIGFMDRFCGTLILTGGLTQVQTAVEDVVRFFDERLGFAVCEVHRS